MDDYLTQRMLEPDDCEGNYDESRGVSSGYSGFFCSECTPMDDE